MSGVRDTLEGLFLASAEDIADARNWLTREIERVYGPDRDKPAPAEIQCPRCGGPKFSMVEYDNLVRASTYKDGTITVDCDDSCTYSGDTHATHLVCENGCGLEFPVPPNVEVEFG